MIVAGLRPFGARGPPEPRSSRKRFSSARWFAIVSWEEKGDEDRGEALVALCWSFKVGIWMWCVDFRLCDGMIASHSFVKFYVC